MNKRTVIGLAVVNAALLAFILIYERGTLSTSDTASRSNQVLRSFVRDRIDRVELVRGDDDAIVFVRERDEDAEEGLELGTWTIAEPLESAADDDAVDSLLSALEWLGAHRTREDVTADDREQFGLDEPRFVVRFTVIEEQVELRIGGEAPTGDGVYAMVEGEDRVYIVESDFVESVDHDVAHFRNREVFDGFYPTGVERVVVDDVTFEREGGVWRLREPVRGWANLGLVDRLNRLTRELNATRFITEDADDLETYGLDAPWHELTITRSEDVSAHRVAHLRVGDACGEHDAERYAIEGDDGPVVCVNESDLEVLSIDRDALREARLLTLGDDTLERVVLTAGDTRIEIRREENRWKLFTGTADSPGEPALADDDAVSGWLASLRENRAGAYEAFDESAHGIDSPVATIRFVRQNDQPDVELTVGEADAVGVWVRRGDESALVRFDPSLSEAIVASPLRFRARQIFEAEAADASRITTNVSGVDERAVRGQGGTWSLETPIEAEADRVVVRDLARQLATLRAARFVADSAAREHGLSTPSATVSAVYTPDEGEEAEVTLRIGATTDGGSFAQRDGLEAVFVLATDVVIALTRSLVSLDLLTVDAEGLESLRLERGEQVVTLTREGTAWQTADGETPDNARTRALMDRLGTLRAVGVVGYSDAFGPVALRVVATRRPTVEGERTVTLELGEPQGEGDEAYVPMRAQGVGVVYRVRPDTVRSMLEYTP